MRQAGWYLNPDGLGGERYWDGSAWTDLVRANAPAGPYPPAASRDRGGGRVARGFRMIGVAAGVVGDAPGLIVVIAAGLVVYAAISAGLFYAILGRLPDGHDFTFPHDLIAIPILMAGSAASSYANFVVTAVADRRLRGEPATVRDGIAVANRRLGRLVAWTAVSLGVGLVVQVLAERIKVGGLIARWLLGMAWGLATTFVVPILVLEDVGVGDAVRRSAATFKAKWGETVVADAGVGSAVMIALIPLAVVAGAVAIVSTTAAILVGVAAFGILVAVSGAVGSVVSVALYRFAVDGFIPAGVAAADLQAAYRPRRR